MTVRQASLQSPSLVQQQYGREGGGEWSEAVMLHEKFPSRPNWRFHSASISATFAWLRIADEMTQEIASDSHEKDTAASVRVRPRARDYFWRPWYAKLWWSLAFGFWLAVLFDALVVRVLPRGDQGWQFWVVMLLQPHVIVPVLGFPFLRDWLEFQGFYDTDEGEEQPDRPYEGGNGVDFHVRPANPMDPFDPRFNALPNNPASPAWRERHGWNGN